MPAPSLPTACLWRAYSPDYVSARFYRQDADAKPIELGYLKTRPDVWAAMRPMLEAAGMQMNEGTIIHETYAASPDLRAVRRTHAGPSADLAKTEVAADAAPAGNSNEHAGVSGKNFHLPKTAEALAEKQIGKSCPFVPTAAQLPKEHGEKTVAPAPVAADAPAPSVPAEPHTDRVVGRWSDEDRATLVDMFAHGATAAAVAAALNRDVMSVKNQINEMGLRSRRQRRLDRPRNACHAWHTAETRALRDLAAGCFSVDEIAEILCRQPSTIVNQAAALGIALGAVR